MSKSANSYKQIASGPNAGTSFATLQELKRQASLATKPLEPTIVEPSASTNSPPAAPRMTAAELDTTISQLEQDLIHNEEFETACIKLTELVDIYLDLRTRKRFDNCVDVVSGKILGDTHTREVAMGFVNAMWLKRRFLTSHTVQALERTRKLAETIPQSPSITLVSPSKPRPRIVSPRKKLHPPNSTIPSHLAEFVRLSDDAYATGISEKKVGITNYLMPVADILPDPANAKTSDDLYEFANVPMNTYPFVELLEPPLLSELRIRPLSDTTVPSFILSTDLASGISNGSLSLRLMCIDDSDPLKCHPISFDSILVEINGVRLSEEVVRSSISYHAMLIHGIPLDSHIFVGLNTIRIQSLSPLVYHGNFSLSLRLVRFVSTDRIAQQIASQYTLRSEACLDQIRLSFDFNSDDIQEMSRKIPIRDAVSLKRIIIPARGLLCSHAQCFDLETFLELNIRNPTFKCPVCNALAPLDGLIVDSFFQHILFTLLNRPTIQEIVVYHDGRWEPIEPDPSDDCSSDGDRCNIERAKRKFEDVLLDDSISSEPWKRRNMGR